MCWLLALLGRDVEEAEQAATRCRWSTLAMGSADAAQVVAHLVALDREVRELLLTRDPDLPPRNEDGPC